MSAILVAVGVADAQDTIRYPDSCYMYNPFEIDSVWGCWVDQFHATVPIACGCGLVPGPTQPDSDYLARNGYELVQDPWSGARFWLQSGNFCSSSKYTEYVAPGQTWIYGIAATTGGSAYTNCGRYLDSIYTLGELYNVSYITDSNFNLYAYIFGSFLLSGMLITRRDLHKLKAVSSILTTPEPKVTVFKDSQSEQKLDGILREPIIEMDFRSWQSTKAISPIFFTLLGITTSVIPEFSKALLPIVLTDFGNSMLLRPVHPAKACSPISVTESGITILVNSAHFSKAYFSITVVPSGMIPTPSFISYFAIGQFHDYLYIERFYVILLISVPCLSGA